MTAARLAVALAATLAVFTAGESRAEFQFSVYGGYNSSPSSTVTVTGTPNPWSNSVVWDGESFKSPPYYGVRGTYWLSAWEMPNWGVALDFTHAKVAADPLPAGVTTLEFTDGINYVTANLLYRFPNETAFTPYVGVGGGLSIPHVEYQFGAGPRTFEYQLTGGVVQGLAGVDYKLTEMFSLFAEYRGSYSWNEASLNGGGTLTTNIFTNQLIAGLSIRFGGP